MYTLFEIVSSLPISDSENRTLGVKHVQVSINFARKNMHDYIIDKTCIDRIIENNTDCFHKEYIVISSVCGILSLKRIST